ncbi:alpha/beta hydrolase family protein [Caulobacter hibisci]|uniref:S9 family peptidase n=1 Tax=Caulobacter hibisci TaxID=2035993 RepID=A0ABS0SZD7_9CAUL|nr:prolyl oligopeptidase family serine peptidase [Caulobacter hibisci]MBI1685001.1 S9 family peptidase [Caulobacter hibisci]
MSKLSLSAAVAALMLGASALAATNASAAPPTAAEWAKRPALRGVSISPDGKHLAGVVSPDGEKTYISVWNADDLTKPPKIIGPPPRSNMVGVRFIKNDRILVSSWQPVETTTGQGFVVKSYTGRNFIMDLDGGNVMTTAGGRDQFADEAGSIIDTLPLDPKNVLVDLFRPNSKGTVYVQGIYKMDAYTGAMTKVLQDSDKFSGVQTDLNGDVRARVEFAFDNGKAYIAQWIRDPATNAWEEHFRSYAADREISEIIGFTKDPNIALVRTSKGRDKSAIFEYDIKAKKMLGEAFAHKLFDAGSVYESQDKADYGEILGFTYEGPDGGSYWLDPTLKAAEDQARKALQYQTVKTEWTDIATGEKARISYPDGAKVSLADWSNDRKRFLIVRSGPKVAAEYYLIVDGQIKLLAKAKPWIAPETLGDMRVVQYPARDGLIIPAFLTTPPKASFGEGPYPTIILPHGGPWGRDDLGWDGSGWVQYFAARGYAVLQPQFRGSEGWGQKLWRAGDKEWGQKMQDDKDDGARWLIDQKIAAPDRIAMHGFSYGGYSAMAASVRPNGLYQCAIAGAGVSEIARIKTGILSGSRWGKEFQEPTIDGLSPLKNADKVSIPILVYHGDRDLTVEMSHSERFVQALKNAGKDVTFVKIADMAHTAGDTPDQQVKVLTTIENYLKTGCGPGGL